ncbi:MAG: sulfate permease, partial [Gammaproteobacteria bacterium]
YLPGDILAGVIVMIMLVPQSMAYALLAGLPPYMGLYASMLPLLLYGLCGSSMTLAIGPVAIVSLMVASALSGIAEPGTELYVTGAITLAMLSGVILVLLGIARFDYFVNYLSRPVLSGFISAATILIAVKQLQYLLGLPVPPDKNVFGILLYVYEHIRDINLPTAAIGIISIIILLLTRKPLELVLIRCKFSDAVVSTVTKTGALVAVIAGILLVWTLELDKTAGVDIVADIPSGLPPVSFPLPELSLVQELIPAAILISLVGYLEGISVARLLASKRRQKIKPNNELIALGAANMGAALTGGFPVAGGISRSSVNFTAGANTPLASIITAVLIAIFVAFFAQLLYYLPRAVLSAIVIMAVLRLFDLKPVIRTWHFNNADSISLLTTFICVLVIGVEIGILIGAVVAITFYLWRTSRPHIAIVGRVGNTEHFRNVERYEVKTCPEVIAIRIDGSLYFANAQALEERILEEVTEKSEVKSILLICSAINFIDASALETLESILTELRAAGVDLYLCEVKEPVLDQFKHTDFLDQLGTDKIYISTHEAMTALKCV